MKYSSEWYQKNKEKISKYQFLWRQKNREKVLNRHRSFYSRNKERLNKEKRERYYSDPEFRGKILENTKKWALENPRKRKKIKHKNYLKTKLKQEIKHYGRPRKEILEHFNYICQDCGIKGDNKLHIHHRDHSGNLRNKPMNRSTNNDFSNLIVWCNSCHLSYHGLTYQQKARKCVQLFDYIKNFAIQNNIPLPPEFREL